MGATRVPTRAEVLAAVDAAYRRRPEHTVSWPAPHPDRDPLPEEYSRVTDPARYVVVGVRAEAWVEALVGLGLADAVALPGGPVRLVPTTPGALSVDVHVRAALGADDGPRLPGTGVDLLVGDPTTVVAGQPVCGCDACDDGSEQQLAMVDDAFVGVLGGGFVLIEDEAPSTAQDDGGDAGDPDRVRIVATANGWSSSGSVADPGAEVAAARRGARRPGRRTLVGAAWWSA